MGRKKLLDFLRNLLISNIAAFDTIDMGILIETIEGAKKIREKNQ